MNQKNLMKSMTASLSVLALVFVFATVSSARADDNFAKKHPRRAEVLKRDKKLNNRTQNAENNGKITQGQANKLDKEEGAIHNQEKADAAANGGHITKSEQRDLNREENDASRRLKRDERKDANGSAPVGTPPAAAAPTTPSP